MQFISPKNLKEALLARQQCGYPILAGGTDLIAQWKASGNRPFGVINISGIKELKGIKESKNSIMIGAGATHSEIFESKIVKKFLPALATACGTVGALQIQNRGTIGGNVMNGSPAGDTLPVLLAYDAEVELVSLRGSRLVPFAEFFTGYRKTVAAKDEVVTKFIIKKPGKGESAVFLKVGTRRAQAISKVCGCFRKIGRECIITYGSVAPTPIRCRKTEDFLKGKKLTPEVIGSALKLVGSEVAPIDDIRSNASYRRHVAKALLSRFLGR